MRFAQIEVGAVIDGGRRQVTEKEMIEFARRYDPQWYHTDPERARRSRWQGLIASGWLTCSIAMELLVRNLLADSESIGSPGIERLKWPTPLRPGDEVELRVEVLRSSVTRSGALGVVRWRWVLQTQAGTTVLDCIATSLFELQASEA
ncbi:MAG TPA: MaoC/PaaZ C-terminal domain-containing protein [Steroidobacteraceae bacterium]|nr:MaoC/PaaZ C-terminal domain-containing protein [Steroidobacteraceae bacterium]